MCRRAQPLQNNFESIQSACYGDFMQLFTVTVGNEYETWNHWVGQQLGSDTYFANAVVNLATLGYMNSLLSFQPANLKTATAATIEADLSRNVGFDCGDVVYEPLPLTRNGINTQGCDRCV